MNVNIEYPPINILLADDDIDDRFFFAKALAEIPIATKLITVANGEELMDYLLLDTTNLPDVLFLDLSMPRKTGFECLVEIKNDKKLEVLDVIMFTTSYTRALELEVQLSNTLSKMGAQDYIRKPANFEQLKDILHTTLKRIVEKTNQKNSQKKQEG